MDFPPRCNLSDFAIYSLASEPRSKFDCVALPLRRGTVTSRVFDSHRFAPDVHLCWPDRLSGEEIPGRSGPLECYILSKGGRHETGRCLEEKWYSSPPRFICQGRRDVRCSGRGPDDTPRRTCGGISVARPIGTRPIALDSSKCLRPRRMQTVRETDRWAAFGIGTNEKERRGRSGQSFVVDPSSTAHIPIFIRPRPDRTSATSVDLAGPTVIFHCSTPSPKFSQPRECLSPTGTNLRFRCTDVRVYFRPVIRAAP